MTSIVLEQTGRRHYPGRSAFRGIQQASIGRRVSRTEGVGASCRKQTKYFTPCEKDKSSHDDEHVRLVAKFTEAPVCECAKREHDRHRILTPDDVRNPAEEGTREAVKDVVEDERTTERRCSHKENGYFVVGEPKGQGDRRYLCRRHQPRAGDQDEHDVEQPEDRCLEHVEGCIL